MATEQVRFDGGNGRELFGTVDFPDGEVKGWVLFAHCFTCHHRLPIAFNMTKQLNSEGVGVFRFDFTGLGESEGEFGATNFASQSEDLVAAADYMSKRGIAPGVLVGHSLGGAAVLSVLDRISGVRAVATIGAPAHPAHAKHLLDGLKFEDGVDETDVDIAGRKFRVTKKFMDDLRSSSVLDKVTAFEGATLVFHAPEDDVVEIENAEMIFNAATHPRSFVSLDRADHLVSNPVDATFLGHVLSAWAGHYLTSGD